MEPKFCPKLQISQTDHEKPSSLLQVTAYVLCLAQTEAGQVVLALAVAVDYP